MIVPYYRHVVEEDGIILPVVVTDSLPVSAVIVNGGYQSDVTFTEARSFVAVPLRVGENQITITADIGEPCSLTVHRVITDRTQDDVNALKALIARPVNKWSEADIAAFASGVIRGAYGSADINRVERAALGLAAEIERRGYIVSIDSVKSGGWTESEWMTTSQSAAYLASIEPLRWVFPVSSPDLPEDMDGFIYSEANAIEAVLTAVDAVFPRIEKALIYSGEAFAGEF